MNAVKLKRILLHEIVHAVINETQPPDRKRFNEEEVCDLFGMLVLPVLLKNPRIVDFLFERGSKEWQRKCTAPTRALRLMADVPL